MASEWKIAPLGELYDFSSGLSKPREEFGFGHGFLSFKDVFYNYFAPENLEQLVNSTEKEQQTCSIQRGDVFLTRTSETMDELGMSCVALKSYERATFNGFTKRLRPKGSTKIVPEYAGYYFRSPSFRREVTAMSSLSTRASLNNEMLSRLKMVLPPVTTQEAIGSILKALDDKIELNRRMNATLEAMARALFQSWFVDFDPVRAKLDGRKPEGLDKATAALFPDAFQESPIGPVPKGWKVGVLDELISFVIGGDWGASEPTEDETVSCYCIRGADIPSLQGGGVGKMPTRFLKQSSVEKRQLMDGDLAIEISGGSPTQCTGRPVLISDALSKSLSLPIVASNFCRIVKLKSPAFSKFVYCWLRYLYDAGSLFQFETGTTGIKNFAFVLFCEKYPLVVPEQRIAEAFDNAVSPLFVRIQANALQSRTLATLRDTLLPKLLNGELSVVNFLL